MCTLPITPAVSNIYNVPYLRCSVPYKEHFYSFDLYLEINSYVVTTVLACSILNWMTSNWCWERKIIVNTMYQAIIRHSRSDYKLTGVSWLPVISNPFSCPDYIIQHVRWDRVTSRGTTSAKLVTESSTWFGLLIVQQYICALQCIFSLHTQETYLVIIQFNPIQSNTLRRNIFISVYQIHR